MKKYLMTGMAALAICAAFTSCSKETNVYNPDQPKEDIKLSYDQAFVKVFGQPAYDQDWGFGTAAKARTRGYIDANGNLWEGAPTVGADEPKDVSDYVAALETLPMSKPSNLTDFYVTHIWKGTDYYTAYSGGDEFLGSDIMDQLIIADKDNCGVDKGQGTLNAGEGNPGGADAVWHHIYDFNGGQNRDYSGNMLMKDSGTKNFAYWNSKDNKWHDRWIAVNGADIDAYYGYTGANKKYSGYWYICFDYEGTPKENSESFTVVSWKIPGINPGETYERKMRIEGIWTLEDLYKEGTVITDNMNTNDGVEYTVYQEGTSDWAINQVSQGDKYTPGDGVYTDWIIRLVKAEDDPTPDPDPEYSIRVIGEDLTFGEDLDTDFDFNDVVFDVALNVPNKTFIKVKAAGGTLPLIIGVASPQNDQEYNDYEVHHLFGFTNTSVMINTNATAAGLNGATANDAILELTTTYTNARDIPVYVKKNGVWCELTAQAGEPASKIGISNMDFRWCDERVSLKTDYPLFTKWVEATKEFRDQISWW